MPNILTKTDMRHIYTILFVMGISALGWSQSQKQYIDAAEKAFLEKNYYAALSYYLEAQEFDTTDVNLMYNTAESARLFSSYTIAEQEYHKVVERDDDNLFPLSTFRLAEMYQMQGDYDSAKMYYELYLSEQEGEDQYFTAKAKKELSSIEWSQTIIDNTAENITINNYGEGVNTPNSEFGAVMEDEGISYSSLAFDTEEQQYMPEKPISRVLRSGDVESEEYAEGFNQANRHTAHTAYNLNKSKIYYTICEYLNNTDIRCDIYSRAILGDGTLGEEMKLPDHINKESTTSTQPNIGFDRSLGQEVLYFVSDRDGGDGKLDIWYSVIEGVNAYSDPINMSAINTAEDDITPFFHNNSQVLYFSSEGYISLGGFDIYRSVKEDAGFAQVDNVGAPINSSYNDIYYSLNDEGSEALFSSNRMGAQYIDPLNESCCYDIYKAEIEDLNINLNALTFDANSLDSLSGVTVQLIDAATGEVIAEITNDMGSDHIFQLERGKEYLVVSSKEGYTPDTMSLNTNRIYRSEDITRKIFLGRSSLDLQVLTFDDISKLPLPGTTVKLIDLTDNTVEVIELTNETAHDFSFNVKPGNRYRVEVTKDRYKDKSIEFVAADEDGSGVMVRKIFLERKDLNIYLPLALYFDNDIPDPRSVTLTTSQNYTETFDKYVVKKQEFADEYTSDMDASEKLLGEQRVQDFFENDVKKGFDNFYSFLQSMLKQLNEGKTFELSLRGFASPRADQRYNLALSQRRVVSVENEMREYANGAFLKFINNGQLKITQLSYGENLAPDNVSDVFYDRRNSIYSPEASKERRVEIVEIKTQLINE